MVLCGCYRGGIDYYYGPSGSDYLPLVDTEAHATILSTTSSTLLKQTFVNPSSSESIEECTYTFPLYDGVSVVGFTCTIGSRTLRGLVKEKAKAKEIFDAAVARGETAGLLEQSTKASDVFSTKLGNIPAGATIIVEITYIGELKHDDIEGIRFTIPTSIAPRYEAHAHHWDSGPSPPQPDGKIKITVDVNLPEGLSVKEMRSPSHPIAVSIGNLSTAVKADPALNKASATLALGTAALEKDFVLIVQSKGTGTPKALLETHSTIPNHRALMATLVPKFSLPQIRPEIVFVADRSGSMAHNIPMLISALKVFLKSIPAGVSFNICSFGTSHQFLWPKSRSYTKENLNESITHISTFDANFGGTETFGAIKATIENRLPDLPLEIILLTDGDIWAQKPLFAYLNEEVEKSAGNIRLFPLGIGSGVSHSLIEGLARAGNGFSQAVQDGERLDNSVVRMLRGALTPHITNYTLEVKYEQEDDDFEVIEKVADSMKLLLSDKPVGSKEPVPNPQATISLFDPSVNAKDDNIAISNDEIALPNVLHPSIIQAPHKIPSLFEFSRTTVYLLLGPETIQRNPTSVILRATSPHGPLAVEIPIEVLAERGQTIHQLAARKASQDLEESRGWILDGEATHGVLIKDKYPTQLNGLIQKEAVRLGETFQVANQWCSFVAVSANDGNEVYVSFEERQSEARSAMPQKKFRKSAASPTVFRRISSAASQVFEKPTKKSAAISPVSFGTEYNQAIMAAVPPPPPGQTTMPRRSTRILAARLGGGPSGQMLPAASASLSPPSSPAAASIQTPAEKVLALIDLQNFDGSWAPGADSLPTILGFAIPQAPAGVEETTWVTILVISFLQLKMADEEGMWGLVVDKAKAYVQANVQDGLAELEKTAGEVVGKN